MPKIGRYKYPTMGLDKTLMKLEKVEEALKEGISVDGLREALGMKIGGAFTNIVASMRMFGLVEGRGMLNLTELAETILHGYSEEEKRRAREEAWLNVEAISLVHGIFKGKMPERKEVYLAILAEKTGEKDRAKLPKKANKVLTLYKKALSDILVEEIPEEVVEKPLTERVEAVPLPSRGIIEIKAKDYYQRLPLTSKGIDIGIEFLNLLKSQVKEEETEEKGEEE